MKNNDVTALVVANTFLEKAFEESVPLNLLNLNYLLFLFYSNVLYNLEYSLFEEKFFKTFDCPLLHTFVELFEELGSDNIIDYFADCKGRVWVIPFDNNPFLIAIFEYVWNLYKVLPDEELLEFLKNNYPSIIDRANGEITNDEILLAEIKIHEEKVENAKKRCKIYHKTSP